MRDHGGVPAVITPPSGTVAFLFTDIEGSTRLWDEHPDLMSAALERHDELLRTAIVDNGGYVFSTAGDAFSAAFSTPMMAVEAAVQAQRALQAETWPAAASIAVRMGLHLGSAQERDGDYFGPALNRAARVMGLAHGGQVVCSLAVEELVRDGLPAGVGLVDLGEQTLRGLERGERVFQVSIDGLVNEFAPLRTSSASTGNLPTPATSFVGRSEDVKRLSGDVAAGSARLVTLTGVGGVGKTRLALETAWALTDEFPDGAWLVELASVGDPASVVPAVGDVVDARPASGMTIEDAIVDQLRSERSLLVLDNCEHVLDALGGFVSRVVSRCPRVAILATSREPLGVDGEHVRVIRSLDPVLEGVELFCERASAADGDFDLGDDRDHVEELCARLDGIPLAIELAAARVRSMGPRQLTERLEDRFRLLRAGRRGGIERHRTLRATVDWSYRLLEDVERTLFDRLSVFSGGFDLAAVEVVCCDDAVDELDVVDFLGGLVDKSLVTAERTGGEDRYRLLETLRQYGEEQLEESGDLALLLDRRLSYYRKVATTARERFEGTEHQSGRSAFEAEWDNLRAALHWANSNSDGDAASELIAASFSYAEAAQRREHGEWARRTIDYGHADPTVYGALSLWLVYDGAFDDGVHVGQQGLALAPSQNDISALNCWKGIANALHWSGRVDEGFAATAMQASIAARSNAFDEATCEAMQAMAATWGDRSASPEHLRNARRLADPLANASLNCLIDYIDARVAHENGRPAEAAALHLENLTRSEECGNRWIAGTSALALAVSSSASGNEDPELWFDAVTRLHKSRNWMYLWALLETLALKWVTGEPRRRLGAILVGHLEANQNRYPPLADQREIALNELRSDPQGAQWMNQGASAPRDDIVSLVLEELADGDHSAGA